MDYNFKSISIEASDYLEVAVPDQKDWVFIKNSNDFVTCGIEEGFEEGNSVFLKKQKSIFLNKPSKLAIALSNVNMNHSKMLKNSFLEHVFVQVYQDFFFLRLTCCTSFLTHQLHLFH